MPQMGVSVSEGTVTKWLKQVGEHIESDETLLEISTDKVDTEVPSPGTGVVTEILVNEGETVEVGTILARISPEGAAPPVAEPAPPEPAPAAVEPVAAEVAAPVAPPARFLPPGPQAMRTLSSRRTASMRPLSCPGPTCRTDPRSGRSKGQLINPNCFGLPDLLQNGPYPGFVNLGRSLDLRALLGRP